MKIPAPPHIPPPPPPVFVGAGEKKAKDDLGTAIRGLLTCLIKITYVPGWQDMLYKFRDAINPGGTADVTRLPYRTSSPNLMRRPMSRGHATMACLYTRLSWIIQAYWQIVVHDEGGGEDIRRHVVELAELIGHTDERGNQLHLSQVLLRCDVVGNVRKGYELKWRGTL
ncbi:MAG: hypothetical protein GY832_31765 [Chloroflexi bacterium]|nr:hypothetical protein [Chloroflexota bacterium]